MSHCLSEVRISVTSIALQERFVPRRDAFMEIGREKASLAPLLCAILLQSNLVPSILRSRRSIKLL